MSWTDKIDAQIDRVIDLYVAKRRTDATIVWLETDLTRLGDPETRSELAAQHEAKRALSAAIALIEADVR